MHFKLTNALGNAYQDCLQLKQCRNKKTFCNSCLFCEVVLEEAGMRGKIPFSKRNAGC